MKKLIFVAIVVLVAVVAWKLGYVGKLAGVARVHALPADPELLSFFDAKAKQAFVVQIPLVKAPESEKLGKKMEDLATDIENAAGVRLALDVDAIAIDQQMQVARGRFNWARMSERLAAAGYVITNDEDTPIAIKSSSGDAVAVVGSYAIHGKADVVTAAVTRHRWQQGVQKDAPLAQLFREIGWGHASVGAMKMAERPDLGQVLQGNVLPQAAAFALDRKKDASEVSVLVVAGTASHAASMATEIREAKKRLLDEMRDRTDPLSVEIKRSAAATTIEVDGDRVAVWVPVSDAFMKLVIDEGGSGARALSPGATEALVRSFVMQLAR